MSRSDPIADMLTRIRNAHRVGKPTVLVPASRMHERVLEVLKRSGYIESFNNFVEEEKPKTTGKRKHNGMPYLQVSLKYVDGNPAIIRLERISRPGRRIYTTTKTLPRVSNGLGMSILSTSSGVISDHEARTRNVGGEILCMVF